MKFIAKLLTKALCRFGHDKEYLALKDAVAKVRCSSAACCTKPFHDEPAKEARWSCKRCGELGSDILTKGAWKIEFGKLLPDPKAWANWEGLPGKRDDE